MQKKEKKGKRLNELYQLCLGKILGKEISYSKLS
jgi:hypothetical protein